MLKTVVLLYIIVEKDPFLPWIESSKEQHLYEKHLSEFIVIFDKNERFRYK